MEVVSKQTPNGEKEWNFNIDTTNTGENNRNNVGNIVDKMLEKFNYPGVDNFVPLKWRKCITLPRFLGNLMEIKREMQLLFSREEMAEIIAKVMEETGVEVFFNMNTRYFNPTEYVLVTYRSSNQNDQFNDDNDEEVDDLINVRSRLLTKTRYPMDWQDLIQAFEKVVNEWEQKVKDDVVLEINLFQRPYFDPANCEGDNFAMMQCIGECAWQRTKENSTVNPADIADKTVLLKASKLLLLYLAVKHRLLAIQQKFLETNKTKSKSRSCSSSSSSSSNEQQEPCRIYMWAKLHTLYDLGIIEGNKTKNKVVDSPRVNLETLRRRHTVAREIMTRQKRGYPILRNEVEMPITTGSRKSSKIARRSSIVSVGSTSVFDEEESHQEENNTLPYEYFSIFEYC